MWLIYNKRAFHSAPDTRHLRCYNRFCTTNLKSSNNKYSSCDRVRHEGVVEQKQVTEHEQKQIALKVSRKCSRTTSLICCSWFCTQTYKSRLWWFHFTCSCRWGSNNNLHHWVYCYGLILTLILQTIYDNGVPDGNDESCNLNTYCAKADTCLLE